MHDIFPCSAFLCVSGFPLRVFSDWTFAQVYVFWQNWLGSLLGWGHGMELLLYAGTWFGVWNPRAAINPGQGAQMTGAGKLLAELCVSQQAGAHSWCDSTSLALLCVFWDTEHGKMVQWTSATHALRKWNAVYMTLWWLWLTTWHMSNDLDWLLLRGISFKALMALGSYYLQELIEAYVFPCSLCSAEDHPLPASICLLQDLSCGLLPHLCVLSHFPQPSEPAGTSHATTEAPCPGIGLFYLFIVTSAISKAALATGLGSLVPTRMRKNWLCTP